MKISFNGNLYSLSRGKYPNKRLAITLTDEEGYPCNRVTVNLPDVSLEDGEIIIKDYSENEGILDCFIENKIVSKPLRHVNSGFVRLPVVKLLIPISEI